MSDRHTPLTIRRCGCGHSACTKWVIETPFNVDGKFDEEAARFIERTCNSHDNLLRVLKAFLNGDSSVSHMKVAYEDARIAVAEAEGEL